MPKKISPIKKPPSPKTNRHARPMIKKLADERYIDIRQIETAVKTKQQLTYAIVAMGAVLVAIFWFWSLQKNVQQASRQNSQNQANLEMEKIINDLKNVFSDTGQILGQLKGPENGLAALKDEIMSEIKTNIDSANWPTHTSSLLNLSFRYPTDWQKTESAGRVIISFPATDTEKLASSLTIEKKNNSTNLAMGDWLAKNFINPDYQTAGEKSFSFGQATEYLRPNVGENNLDYVIFVSRPKAVYQISVFSRGGRTLHQPIMDLILETINFF